MAKGISFRDLVLLSVEVGCTVEESDRMLRGWVRKQEEGRRSEAFEGTKDEIAFLRRGIDSMWKQYGAVRKGLIGVNSADGAVRDGNLLRGKREWVVVVNAGERADSCAVLLAGLRGL